MLSPFLWLLAGVVAGSGAAVAVSGLLIARTRRDAARRAAEGRRHLLQRFLDMASATAHDVNGQIGKLRLLLDLLAGAGDDEERGRHRATMTALLDHMAASREDVLTLFAAPAEADRACDAADVMRTKLEGWRALAYPTRVALGPLPSAAMVPLGPAAFAQICENLVGNAAAAHAHTVTLDLAATREDGRRAWILSAADDGTGVPAAVRDTLFDPFVSTRPQTGEAGALPRGGLGLAIVERNATAAGGRVAHRPAKRFGPRPGAVFTVVLPGV